MGADAGRIVRVKLPGMPGFVSLPWRDAAALIIAALATEEAA